VTPQNILLSYEGAVKLTDFGIAKAGTRASTVGMLKGKFAYMSPEQSRGEQVDARTDIFALGITLWELLTGQQLFDADSDIAVLRAVQERTVASPEQLNPGVDRALGTIVMRCLERERTDRFQAAQELERALNRYVINRTDRSEEMELATWIRGLFPEEATRTEATVARHIPSAGQERAAAAGVSSGLGEVGAIASRGSSLPPPPVLLAPAESGERASPTGATPVLPSQQVWEESPTRRKMRAWWARKPWVPAAVALVCVLAALGLHFRKSGIAVQDNSQSARPEAALTAPAQPSPAPAGPNTASGTQVRSAVAAAGPRKLTTSVRLPAPETGILELTVGPFGEVFIDGKSRGEQVGTVRYPLTPGEHQLDIKGAVHWGPKRIQIQSRKAFAQSAWVQ
jgi:eukaryotic-like serine/threonine-protein kinase